MNKKNISISIVVVLLIISLIGTAIAIKKEKTNNKASKIEENSQVYPLSSYIDEQDKLNANRNVYSLSLAYEYTPKKMEELCTDIAIIKVISEDYMDPSASILGMTFGKMLINTPIKGNIESGDVVIYEKPGGYIDLQTYNESRPKASQEKREYLRNQAGLDSKMSDEYIFITVSEDIEIEVGKTYLAYLTYNEFFNAYEIIGLGNGLREINVEKQKDFVKLEQYNIDDLKIKNNNTQEWEELNMYISKNIKDAKI